MPGLDQPGLGVEIDESWLKEAAAEGFRLDLKTAASDNVKRGSFLRRRDGSYTNS